MVDDVRHWEPQSLPDVVISNAVLQWVPGHRELLVRWADRLAPDGWLAFQVPGNFDQPSHAILRELAASARWRPLLRDVELNRQSADPADYADLLARAGFEVDAWETTYVHILPGEDPVLEWYKGTGLRRCWPHWMRNGPGTSSPSTARGFARRIHLGRSAPFSPSAACSPWLTAPADPAQSNFFPLI